MGVAGEGTKGDGSLVGQEVFVPEVSVGKSLKMAVGSFVESVADRLLGGDDEGKVFDDLSQEENNFEGVGVDVSMIHAEDILNSVDGLNGTGTDLSVDSPLGQDSFPNDVSEGLSSQGKVSSLVNMESPLTLAEVDQALDLCEAQPLQNMSFLKDGLAVGESRRSLELGAGVGGSKWSEIREIKLHEESVGMMGINEEFPP